MKKPVASINSPGQLTVLAALLAGLCAPALAGSDVVISQVYGAGGNSGATFKNDFIELFNRTSAPIAIGNWSVQYAATAGSTWAKTAIPAGTVLAPGQYYLVIGSGGTTGANMPTPDVTGTLSMAAGAGKVALVNNNTLITAGVVNPTGTAGVLDVVGYGPATTAFETAPTTPNLTATTAAIRKAGGCTDDDNNSTDFLALTPTPRNTASATTACGYTPPPVAAPIVISTCPATLAFTAGTPTSAGLVAGDQDSVVNSVSITAGARAGISLTSFLPASGAGGNATVNLSVDASLPVGNFPVDVTFGNGDGQSATCTVTVKSSGSATIPQIQGSGATSPFNNSVMTTDGVITMKLASGFFIQDQNGDGDPTTSDGIFVFGGTTSAQVGDLVRVTGTVTEFTPANATRSYTEFKDTTAIVTLGTVGQLTPANVTMPANLANYEGMLVRFTNPLIINQVSNLGDRGEMTLASVRREVPTNRYPAGSAGALQLAASNAADQIVLDDGIFTQSPTIPYIAADQTVRVGDSVTDLTGVVDYGSIGNSQAGFKLQPLSVAGVTISRTNPRTPGPVLPAGNVRVASANVLNFFTTFTNGNDVFGNTNQGCSLGSGTSKSNCRGADNLAEFVRQRDKIVNELVAMDADVVGLMEIQNNGTTAVSYLVDSVNTKVGFPLYSYVPTPASTGTDAIRVAMIYKPSVVSLVGAPMSDGDSINNRAPLAQTFRAANGATFSVIVNHLKSKASCPSGTGVNADNGDSQGCWNGTRIQQAQRLAGYFIPFVQQTSGDLDVLVIGDMNSHGFEDPINLLTGAGMVNELERFVRPTGLVYSYVFDGESGYLDHALATASLDGQVAGATEWHNNADEPDVIDYNTDGKPQDLYVNNAYRASDHDPVVVSLNLAPTFTNVTSSFSTYRSALAINRSTGQFSGTVTFTNTNGPAINGPFQIEFNGLPSGVTLANATGSRNGVPYITASNANVAPGATVTLTTVFNNPSKGAIPYTATIYSGSF
ncbi:MAG: endonuclease/exonuclease/phosphatase [Massilia sp.]|nr:endonuclease/exonuclease/phosphatase [Massilia sp.]